MTPDDRRRRLARRRREWKESDRQFHEMVARREQRLREWDAHMARRRARLRRLTFGLLGREPHPS